MGVGLLLLVVAAAVALGALLWWRFKGGGKTAAPAVLVATHNHSPLRTFHYEPAGAAAARALAAVATAAAPGAALASLLPAEDNPDSAAPKTPDPAVPETTEPEAAQLLAAQPAEPAETLATPAPSALVAASSRHAAGAVDLLVDAIDEPAPSDAPPTLADSPEPDKAPAAAALFYNPLTTPAPSANDQTNRAAKIALRKQQRARIAAESAGQRTALGELFPAGKGAPAAQPS